VNPDAATTQTVATWITIIGGTVGIVLSLVAIAFAVLVNKRATDVNDETIRGLNKIGADVEHLADDTRQLIKAGWDKMLGRVDAGPDKSDAFPIRDVAAGIAAELRAEFGRPEPKEKGTRPAEHAQDRIEEIIKAVEGTLTAQQRAQAATERPGQALEKLLTVLTSLSPQAQALISLIRWYHLEQEQYRKLREGPLGGALDELRTTGLIVPVSHKLGGKERPCYYFLPALAGLIRAALPLVPRQPDAVVTSVRQELERVGYNLEPPDHPLRLLKGAEPGA